MKKKIIISIIGCLILIIGIIGFIIWNNNRIVSTFTLDINPSIEINLDKNDKVKSVVALNEDAKGIIGKDLKGKTFGVWGLAFKPKTDDMREAPAITIINALLEMGANVKAYDSKAVSSAKKIFGNNITYTKNLYDALDGADAMLLLTEWNEFRRPDFERIKGLLKTPVIFDGRNQYNGERLKASGFEYICVGRI